MAEMTLFGFPQDSKTTESERLRRNAAVARSYQKHKERRRASARDAYYRDIEKTRAEKVIRQNRFKKRNPGRHRELNFKSKYGITVAERDAILAAQGNCCAACKTTEPGGKYKTWHMDHCHETKKTRGVLCHGCNVSLGHMKDSAEKLRLLANYIERHK